LTIAYETAVVQDRVRRAPGTFAGKLLRVTLFITILMSSVVLIEPSPYEFFSAILLLVCFVSGVTIDRKVVPFMILLFAWNFSGAMAMLPVADDKETYPFMATSIYLAINGIMFAALFSQDCVRRLKILRAGYIPSAISASILGAIGFFHLFPGSDIFTHFERASGTFKDANVFGPFLVLPMLFLVQLCLERIRLRYLIPLGILTFGLFLSFSRAAWGNFIFCTALMMVLMFLTAETARARARLIIVGALIVGVLVVIVLFLLSFSSLDTFFRERATLLQSYDSGSSGRFANQLASLNMLLDRPLGFGPLQFDKFFTQAPHNTYVNSFASYGWTGGASYFALVFMTFFVGYRCVFIRTPWQPFYCACLAAWTGNAFESAVIDTDHWRHWYLLAGLVWGLSAATVNYGRRAPPVPMPAEA
jgi:hypothetical protein